MKIEALKNFSQEFMNDIYTNPQLGLLDYLNQHFSTTQEKIKNFRAFCTIYIIVALLTDKLITINCL